MPAAPVVDEFAKLYKQEMPFLTRFLMRLGASPYEAADAAHEAFIAALPDKWESLEFPRAWLRTTAHRCYLKQNDRRTRPVDPVPDRPGGTCPVATVTLKEGNQRVLDALAQLPPTQQQVMAWAQDGFTYEETSKALEMTVAAVRQNHCRARTRLKQILGLQTGGTQ
ncbi:RNA polymerase sigma factor [Streptomyces sp. NBC_01304]|uniref:RNA polymerase sigma factor n=1 Tax=Streptomyces sp. NBC_01304 TaxID=2903818 RepID=UPI002E0F3F62|nr:sigma-70 family RNA polymerase sigma factor [Streptomyces sp. NBC_01304]WSJ90881.1 sigma-70 family RNA polymerase sigma factor [Streptomyces sp. NBC_01304]